MNSISKSLLLQSRKICSITGMDPLVRRLLEGLRSRNRASLAEAITLVETTHASKRLLGRALLNHILQEERASSDGSDETRSFRIGLSGPPGSGKSTFIENFGKRLTKKGHKLAVLAVDPSSSTTGGSILGDKTRMPELSTDINAYIRPSPSKGHLGGVTRSTNESILLCEAAGYDRIIVETVGVGQSEYLVNEMVDMLLLLIPPGSGDELQGIKRGIVELSDLIVVNKADGDLIPAAQRVRYEYISALKYLPKKHKSWKPLVKCISSLTGDGIDDLIGTVESFKDVMEATNVIKRRRLEQKRSWMWSYLNDNLLHSFLRIPSIKMYSKNIEDEVLNQEISPGDGADKIFSFILKEASKLQT